MYSKGLARHWQTYRHYFWLMLALAIIAGFGWSIPPAIRSQNETPYEPALKAIRELGYAGTAGVILVATMYGGELLGAGFGMRMRDARAQDQRFAEEGPGQRLTLTIDSATHEWLAERARHHGEDIESTASAVLRRGREADKPVGELTP